MGTNFILKLHMYSLSYDLSFPWPGHEQLGMANEQNCLSYHQSEIFSTLKIRNNTREKIRYVFYVFNIANQLLTR